MDNGQKTMKISTHLFIVSGIFLVLTCAVIVALVNYGMKQQALVEAEAKIQIMADQYFAIHTYFSQKLKPSLFEFTKPIRSDEYFDPTWMSSTYAIREIIKYIRLAGGGEYYLKDAAVNARTPENEASPLEKDFISALNEDPKLKIRSSVKVVDGKPYLVLQRRGELMEASCLRCHGSPEQAPGDLIRYYGAERSFHRKIGDWVHAVSIRVPLSSTYTNANRFSLKLSGFLLTTLLVFFGALHWLNNRLVFKPLSMLHEKALEILNSKELLGKEIPLPSGRELKELTSAFNKMSISLRYHMDHLEKLVKDRTDELLKTNEQLKLEIKERKQSEEALRESEEKYRTLFESSRDAIMTLAPPTWLFTSGNPATVELFKVKDEAEFISLGPWQLSPERQPDGKPSDEKAKEMIETAMRNGSHFFEWTHCHSDGTPFPAEVILTRMEQQSQVLLQATVRDITDRKHANEQRDGLISDLQKALVEIKTLRGILPICSHCKKIRDDKGDWNQIESYIHKHSDAEFSHGICPECAKKYYPDMDIYDENGEVTQD